MLTQRTLIRFISWDFESQKSLASNANLDRSAASINNRRCADDKTASVIDCVDRLASRTTGRYNILNYEHSFTGLKAETSPESHHTRFAFGKQSARSKCPRSFVCDDYSADRWGYNSRQLFALEAGTDRSTDPLRVTRVLKNKRALQISRAVQSRRKLKMAFEQRAGFLKD